MREYYMLPYKDHHEVVCHNENGEGLVACVAIGKQYINGEYCLLLNANLDYADPANCVVLTEYRTPGHFWLPISKIAAYDNDVYELPDI